MDDAPALTKDFMGRIRSATEGLFPLKRPVFMRRLMQFWLLLMAALIASIVVSATSGYGDGVLSAG